MSEGPSDVVLAHYGVKGMRWGKRKANPVRAAKRAQKLAVIDTKKAMRDERDKSIMDARDRVENSRSNLKDAKKQYKTDRKEVGRKAAKAALINARTKEIPTLMRDSDKATMMTAKEQQQKAMLEIGTLLVKGVYEMSR